MRAKEPKEPSPPPAASLRKRIMVVDDHPMTRGGLVGLINAQVDLQVCCEAGTPAEAMTILAKVTPDLVVTDLSMPGRSGTEFIKDILAIHPDLPVLVLSMHDEDIHAERVLRAGARGYIMKDAGAAKMLEAIRQVATGQVYVSPEMASKVLNALSGTRPRGSNSPIDKLSDREFEVFQMIGQGLTTKEIAGRLHLSPKTVDVHRGNLKVKLGLRDATSLMRQAVRWVEANAPS
jgi:DNA-binding NarL/FixJ family response regulator